LPPLPEQCAIAAYLDRATARIDALIARKKRLLELLAEKCRALISHAVTRGLDPAAPMRDSGIPWLGEIPAHWEVQSLSHALAYISYGFTNPMPIADDGLYMLTANDIGDGLVKYETARKTTEEAYSRLLTDKSRPVLGDVLLTKDGTLGRVALCGGRRACINQSVAILRVNPRVATPDFVQIMLRGAPYQDRMTFDAGGTAIKHIYITRVAKMPMAVPPLPEQRAIAGYLDRETARLDALVGKVGAAIERLCEYRAALISAAVTGKVDVRGRAEEMTTNEKD
jgi:type I restriction enzyme, S subunit